MALLFFLPFLTAAADDAVTAYVHQMEKRIMAAWHLPKRSAGLTIALRMNLERSGRISAVRVEQSSGNEHFDESAGRGCAPRGRISACTPCVESFDR